MRLGKREFCVILFGIVVFLLGGCALNTDERVGMSYDRENRDRGKYLVHSLAACGFCHGNYRTPEAELIGGLPYYDRFGEVLAANLTLGADDPERLNPQNIRRVMRSGRSMGEYVSHEAHAGFGWLADSDLQAIIVYLASLPARPHSVMRRSLSSFELNTLGAFEESFNVQGVVPSLERSDSAAYGRYLVKNVARCEACHNGPSGLFSGEELLAGGKYLNNEFGATEVPAISNLRSRGWSKKEIVRYLKTGETPSGKHARSHFCPTLFFAKADNSDLMAIANYLHGL